MQLVNLIAGVQLFPKINIGTENLINCAAPFAEFTSPKLQCLHMAAV